MPQDGEDAEETSSKDFISSTYFVDYRFIAYIRPVTDFWNVSSPGSEAVLKRRAKVLLISPHCQAALTITASQQRECRPPRWQEISL